MDKLPIQRLIVTGVLIGLLALVLVGCGSSDPEPTEAASAPTATEEPNATEEAVATEEVMPDSRYFTSYQRIEYFDGSEDAPFPERFGEPAEGERFAMITMGIGNQSADEPLTIASEEFMLEDSDGETYTPFAFSDETPGPSPLLYGGDPLATEESINGFVVFAIPMEATPQTLTWCPNGDCDRAFTIPIVEETE